MLDALCGTILYQTEMVTLAALGKSNFDLSPCEAKDFSPSNAKSDFILDQSD